MNQPTNIQPDNTQPNAPRCYLFALVDGGGTVPPELGAARRLLERGHHVTVLAEDSMEADVRASGLDFKRWTTAPNRASRHPDDDPYRDWECKSPLALFSRMMDLQFVGPAAAYANDTIAAIDELHPTLVVSSMFAFGAMIGAESAGVPFDVLFANIYPLPVAGLPPFGMGLKPAAGPLGRGRDRALNSVVQKKWNKAVPDLNAVRASFGLAPLDTFFEQMGHARRHLVLSSTAFDFPAEFPANVQHVGPVLDDPAWAAAPSWTPPAGDDPLVLVGMSTTFQDHVGCLQRVVDALGELPVRAIVTTGPAMEAGALTARPNVTVVPSAPHSEVLRHAAAVVTHGGHGTIMRSLAAGVPMIVMPHGRDQADNAVRVEMRGAGLRVKRSASSAEIARAVRRLIDEPKFRSSATELGTVIRRDAASQSLVDELEAVSGATTTV